MTALFDGTAVNATRQQIRQVVDVHPRSAGRNLSAARTGAQVHSAWHTSATSVTGGAAVFHPRVGRGLVGPAPRSAGDGSCGELRRVRGGWGVGCHGLGRRVVAGRW